MFVRIAVFDPLPVYRHGVMAVLREAGLGTEAPDDVFAWMDDDHLRLVVLSLQAGDDWERLGRLCRTHAGVLVVALLPDDAVTTHVRALAYGAVAALPRDAQPSAVRAAVEAVIGGRTVLPIDVLRSLIAPGVLTPQEAVAPSPRELEWLRHLSTGATVADVADRAGYSERMMFRLLRDLYQRMRTRNRTEALLLARERGWL
ncbi:response regulator transcription factor [Nonomuraea typhae]|uniref:Response regulator transcription factor n=1 Tax=Nonomuraea typhae TaxID=2603600 RepID=A0ABW7Z6J1_9ACTN